MAKTNLLYSESKEDNNKVIKHPQKEMRGSFVFSIKFCPHAQMIEL